MVHDPTQVGDGPFFHLIINEYESKVYSSYPPRSFCSRAWNEPGHAGIC